MSGGGGLSDSPTGTGAGLRPYLKRKKSSFGDTKIAVLGHEGTGKSALSVRFLTKRFIGEYDQTIESKYKYTTVVDTESITFEILDTISNREDCGARDDVLRWGDGFMLVYSVVSRKSFDALQEVKRKIEEAKKGSPAPILMVGNKCDLAHMRQVTKDEGEKLALEFGCTFVEVSASEDVSLVTEAFHALCREVIEFKRRSRTFLDRVFGAFGREKASS
ncbi:ras-related and estrogen-regulated growth inhibitor-like [Argopecten irradians]|uniref:ras-related and estrogen-regulated growth inhibitor-like n=1 Tax=Argopecten irradians TaxID=31199 RepID=UPI003721DC29